MTGRVARAHACCCATSSPSEQACDASTQIEVTQECVVRAGRKCMDRRARCRLPCIAYAYRQHGGAHGLDVAAQKPAPRVLERGQVICGGDGRYVHGRHAGPAGFSAGALLFPIRTTVDVYTCCARRASPRHWLGVLPVRRLNTVVKCACVWKPTSSATSSIERGISAISCLACSMRHNNR